MPFEYVCAKHDELVTAWTNSDFDAFTSSGTTITEAESDGSGAHNCYSTVQVVTGKIYSMSCTVGGTIGSDLTFKISPTHASLNSAQYSQDITSTGAVTVTWTHGADNGTAYVGFRSESQTCDFTVSDFSLTQIGCVAEYLPSGVGHNQWSDSSGNGLDGAVSGATAVNAPDVQRVKLASVTGETTKTDFIPAGYIIQDVITAETAGNAVSGFNIGFGDDDQTVMADVTVAASTTTSQTIAASVATLAADDTIYISASSWNSGSVDIYFTLRRVA